MADVLVLGAGASGLICAREAAGRGLRVTVLERGAAPGRKLAVSGGGKANFTNRNVTPEDYRCAPGGNPGKDAFCAPALAAFTPTDMLQLIRGWNLPFEERQHGQLFLTVPARALAEALLRDCRQRGCRIVCNTTASQARAVDGGFEVGATSGDERMLWRAKALVLALGSPAWPQAGGSGMGYKLAQSLGHGLIPPRPALTPLRLPPQSPLRALAGISLPVRIGVGERSWQDDLLFTHDGLSGPAALKASLFWEEGQSLHIDFLPGQDVAALLDAPQAGKQIPRALLARRLPQRLADALLPADLARRKIAELSRAARTAIRQAVHVCALTPAGTAGLKKAEVCAGGVDTNEIDARSMASLRCSGLYVIGELLDVTGLLGGYNLHWAWASGMAAGRRVASESA